jgi:hypothetical protein
MAKADNCKLFVFIMEDLKERAQISQWGEHPISIGRHRIQDCNQGSKEEKSGGLRHFAGENRQDNQRQQ